MATLIWKFVSFSDVTGDSIDIITFNCSTEKKMRRFIKAMGYVHSYWDFDNEIFENGRIRAELTKIDGYEELL